LLTNHSEKFKAVEKFNTDEHRAIIKTNIGICYSSLGNYVDAVDSCKSAYQIYPPYEKSLYRMALIYREIGDYQ
jgi:tetratricopeptide (TPR) repeat protein